MNPKVFSGLIISSSFTWLICVLSPKIVSAWLIDCKVVFAKNILVRGHKIWMIISLNQCKSYTTKRISVCLPVKNSETMRLNLNPLSFHHLPSVVLLPCPILSQLNIMLIAGYCAAHLPCFITKAEDHLNKQSRKEDKRNEDIA